MTLPVLVIGTASLLCFFVCKKGEPPTTPATPSGIIRGGNNINYQFSATTTDPDGDSIGVRFQWGDGTTSDWSSWVASGETGSSSHSWPNVGTYLVKAQAKDRNERMSDWSAALAVTIETMPAPNSPGAPEGPDSTWTGASAAFRVWTTAARGYIRYVIDWSDAIDTTDIGYTSGETAVVSHTWSTAGTYDIKVKAILEAEPTKASEFSPRKAVKVNANGAPLVDSVLAPPVAIKDRETFFVIYGQDPDGDSLRAKVQWPSGDTTTELSPTPCAATVSHVFTQIEIAKVMVWTVDWKGTESTRDTILVPVGPGGRQMVPGTE